MATMSFQWRIATCRGLSLVDVMLSVVLLAVAFMAAISSLPLIFEAQRRAEQSEPATALALQVMAQARSIPFAALAPCVGSSSAAITANGVPRVEQYTYNVDVVPLADDLKDVTVTVTWTYRGASRSFVLQSRICGAAGIAGEQ